MGKNREMKSRCNGKMLMQCVAIAWSCLLLTLVFAGEVHAANKYTITATAGSGGSISPSGAVLVNNGGNKTFTITPNTGYHIATVTVDSVSQGTITSYTFTNVGTNHTIAATFAINTYTITATAGSNGNISPSGAVVVNYGGSQTFTITPNIGYHVADVTVDGISQGAITSKDITNVAANHTIAATFAINTYALTPTAGSGGSVSPSGPVVVNSGGNQTFTITPNIGYHVVDVTVDGVSQGAITSYTFTNVTATHTIAATFSINTYTITATAGSGGTVSPATATVNYGGSQTFTITPNVGYQLAIVLVDGVSQGAITSYTFTNVTASHALSAVFATNTSPPSSSSSDYYYDDLGRLARVVQGTSGVIYTYDELGNLASTTSATTSGGSPLLTAINPNVLFVGTKMLVAITGQNLLTTETVTAIGGLVSIKGVEVTDSRITAEMTALTVGTETIRLTTRSGATATIVVTLSASKLTFSPAQLAVAPGTSGTVTAIISPPLNVPLTINLHSSAPAVATVPQSVTVPVSGSTVFAVNGIQEGISTIDSGDVWSFVFVSPPFTGDVSGITAGYISVYIDAPFGTSPATAGSVSVYVETPANVTSPGVALPVSVYLDTPAGISPAVAGGVSVKIQ